MFDRKTMLEMAKENPELKRYISKIDESFKIKFDNKPCVCSFCNGKSPHSRCILGYENKEVAYMCERCFQSLYNSALLSDAVIQIEKEKARTENNTEN